MVLSRNIDHQIAQIIVAAAFAVLDVFAGDAQVGR
jgi:hypothetical protein